MIEENRQLRQRLVRSMKFIYTFITEIQLYDQYGELVATGRPSRPIKKGFDRAKRFNWENTANKMIETINAN